MNEPKREVVMQEGRVINKYTLVPVGLIFAAVALTAGVARYVWADKAELITLKSDNAALRREFDAYRISNDTRFTTYVASNNGKMEAITSSLHSLDISVRLIAQKLEVDLPEM